MYSSRLDSKYDLLSILKSRLELSDRPFMDISIFDCDTCTTQQFWRWLESNWGSLRLSDWVENMEEFRQILDRRYIELEGIGYMLDEFTGQFGVDSDYMIEVFVDFCWNNDRAYSNNVYNRVISMN